MRSFLFLCLLWLCSSTYALELSPKDLPLSHWQNWNESQPSWVAAHEPFKVIDNIYYVGTQGIGVYLIVGEEGHVLLDGGLPQSADLIAENIKKLGYKLNDVKFLINSHAHFDHSGGLARLKELTGAIMVASQADAYWLESGYYPGTKNLEYASKPVAVDRIINDAEWLTLKGVQLQANLTPGHSPGCTSWTMSVRHAGKVVNVLFFGSASVAGNQLVGEPQHPGIVEDYRRTFDKIQKWKVDVFLSNHPFVFNMTQKRDAQIRGESHAFVDSDEFPQAVVKMREDFERKLQQQIANKKPSDSEH